MIACLGSVGYWLALPLLAVVGVVAVVAIINPKRLPFPPAGPRWLGRLIGFGVLAIAISFAVLAVDEARDDPDCKAGSAAMDR